MPGRYKVFVECWKKRPTRAGPPPVGYTTPKYQSGATSDIEVEITEESADKTYEWDFPSGGAVKRSAFSSSYSPTRIAGTGPALFTTASFAVCLLA